MYKEHLVFAKPENTDAKIWRFMDFTKFVNLLDTNSLFFTRSDIFDDIFEGTYPKITLDAIRNDPNLPENVKSTAIDGLKYVQENYVKVNYLNCWHMNDYESDAMWKLYTNSNESVAIQSTFKKLTQSINDNRHVYVGLVKYIDYNKELIPMTFQNALAPFVHKRISYSHECEIRALAQQTPQRWNQEELEKLSKGIHVKVNLDTLIESINVAPHASDWFKQLVTSIKEKYHLNKPIESSSLEERPLFK